MARHLVFDVNETLLDLSPLDTVFADLFGDAAARGRWFDSLLHWSTVTTLTGVYRDFSELGEACLRALEAQRGIALDDTARQRVFSTVAALDPHPEVTGALEKLRDRGFTLVALTNSAQASVDAQFERTGLDALFSHVLSVDAVERFKPHPAAYGLAAERLGCEIGALRLVAAHAWDVTGAIRAGCAAAFVARGGAPLNPAGETPDIVGADLAEVAEAIIERDQPAD